MDDLLENLDIEKCETVNPDEFFDNNHNGVPCDMFEQAFALENKTYNEEDRTIKVRYTNNSKVLRYSWLRNEYFYLVLSSKKGHVDLGRLNNGANVVDSHSTYSIKNILGAVVPGSATEKEATIKFSSREDVKPYLQDIKDGILRFVSPGLHIQETKDITKEGEKLKTLLVTKWEPYEISFCATPADPEAQALALHQEVESKLSQRSKKAEKKEQKTMDEEQMKAASAAATAEKLEKAKAEAANEAKLKAQERSDAIFKIADKAKLGYEFAKEMINSEHSIEKIQDLAIDKMAELSKEQDVKSNFSVGETAEDKEKLAMTAALEARAGVSKFETGNKFNNFSLFELAKYCAQKAGAKVDLMNRADIARFAMHSTSDFPNILANIAGKSIRKAYEESDLRTFTKWATKTTLPDFKPVSRVQISEVPTPTKITEGGEFKQTTISDGKETYQLATYGEIISITRQTIINDDLSVLSRVPRLMGSAAARLEGDIVYGILTGSTTMSDNVALFHANHGNLTDALLLADHATLNYFKHFVKMFRTQTGPKGAANLGLYPKYLICGPETENAAKRLLQLIQATKSSDVNVYANSSELVIDPRISDSSYYGAADPGIIDTVEYAYLEGAEGPQITSRNGFEVDGVDIKMSLDFAAAALDWRGLGKSTNNDS